MAYENLLVERHDGVMVVTINRPKVLNALNAQTLTELGQVIDEKSSDDTVRVVIAHRRGATSRCHNADINGSPCNPRSATRARARRGRAISTG